MRDLIHFEAPPFFTQTSPGVTPGFIFNRKGAMSAGQYLAVGEVAGDQTGIPIFGKNKLTKMRVSSSENVNGTTVIQLYKRTSSNTRVAISGAIISIPVGSYSAVINLDPPIDLDDGIELMARVNEENNLKDVVLNVFLKPRF